LPPWLVITAEHAYAGRGVRGRTLVEFLRTYFGRRRVAVRSPRWAPRTRLRADTVLVGLPSSLTGDEIRTIADRTRCRRLAAFDYIDSPQLQWTPEQESALRERTDRYLKPWFEPSWNFGLRMGLLPIRRFHRFSEMLAIQRGLPNFVRPRKHFDVMFLGRPNDTRFWVDGQVQLVDQRVAWMIELVREAKDLRFFGGFVEVSPTERDRVEARFGDIEDLIYPPGDIGFASYYGKLRQSRVLLAPAGNVPWTYRHYECLYAGGVAVTCDYRRRDMLVPLPRENMVHVPDGVPVLPAVREALELSRARPAIGEENFHHLERYLRYGVYSRRRPALIERFIAQFE
jgi:hypothetical protein